MYIIIGSSVAEDYSGSNPAPSVSESEKWPEGCCEGVQ